MTTEAVVFPLGVLKGAGLKFVVLVFLVRGILSARKAQSIRQRLSDEALHERLAQRSA